jgi:transposase
MARLHGRAPRGHRLKAAAPHGHWMTTTFVAASRCDTIAAPCVFDGPPQPLTTVAPPMNGACFLAHVEHFLAPALGEGDVVVMDNLPAHKVAGAREAIERTGATPRHPPPHGPDFNPIEPAFAKFKASPRKAAARTFEDLGKAITQALADFKQQECANYIANSGYRHAS